MTNRSIVECSTVQHSFWQARASQAVLAAGSAITSSLSPKSLTAIISENNNIRIQSEGLLGGAKGAKHISCVANLGHLQALIQGQADPQALHQGCIQEGERQTAVGLKRAKEKAGGVAQQFAVRKGDWHKIKENFTLISQAAEESGPPCSEKGATATRLMLHEDLRSGTILGHADVNAEQAKHTVFASDTVAGLQGNPAQVKHEPVDMSRVSQEEKETSTKENEGLKGTAFAQQRISAWQPVLAPKWMIFAIAFVGVAAIALGIVLILASNSAIECQTYYSDPPRSCKDSCQQVITITAGDCRGPLKTSSTGSVYIEGPVYLYYGLEKFYQNHRRYLLSRSAEQLQGEVILDTSKLASCEPALYSSDQFLILTPCGLAAKSVFNDTLIPLSDAQSVTPYPMRQDVADIVWPADTAAHFKNPSGEGLEKLDQWLPDDIFPGKMENAHFMVWMRNAALPNFRKLYGILDDHVNIPMHVLVHNRYPVSSYGGKKSLILATTTWAGGKNPFLAIVYLTMGSLLFLIGVFMAAKNRQNPRILGDVRFLRWSTKD